MAIIVTFDAFRPLKGQSSWTIRLASRPGFPRLQALRALGRMIRKAVCPAMGQGCLTGLRAVQKTDKTR